MSIQRVAVFLLAFLLVQGQIAQGANVIGRVIAGAPDSEHTYTYPLISGKQKTYNTKSIVKFKGGTVVATRGTTMSVEEGTQSITVDLLEGRVDFRLLPHKTVVGFKTPHAAIFTPRVVLSTNSITAGSIKVTDEDTTIVEITEGSVETLTQNGVTKIESGQAVILSQSSLSPTEEEPAAGSGQKLKSSKVHVSSQQLPAWLLELLELIGLLGDTKSVLDPEGEVEVRDEEHRWDGDAEVVDYSLVTLPDSPIDKNTPVKVVCVRIKDKTTLVRPVDTYYPQHQDELDLIGQEVTTQTDLNPFGRVKLDKDGKDSWKSGEEVRSWELWDSALVDDELQPYEMDDDSDRSENDEYYEDEYYKEGEEFRVVCLRTTLLLQPIDAVSPRGLSLHGKTAVSQSVLTPRGTVLIEGISWNGAFVDYNLQPIEDDELPAGTELEVVGYRAVQGLVLLQQAQLKLEENRFVGNTVMTKTEMDPYGRVILEDNEWWAVVVDQDLDPVVGDNIDEGVELRIVAVMTTLLVQPDPLLIALFPAEPILIILPLVITSGLVVTGTIIAIDEVLDTDEDDEPASPIMP